MSIITSFTNVILDQQSKYGYLPFLVLEDKNQIEGKNEIGTWGIRIEEVEIMEIGKKGRLQ